MILPTTITGSYPRPLWSDRSLAGRSFKSALGDSLFREQYLDAVASVIAEQEAAGLDIVTDGDSRFDLTCVALVEGTNIVRRELGLPEARVRAADPKLWFTGRERINS